jgi:hypothetical protein
VSALSYQLSNKFVIYMLHRLTFILLPGESFFYKSTHFPLMGALMLHFLWNIQGGSCVMLQLISKKVHVPNTHCVPFIFLLAVQIEKKRTIMKRYSHSLSFLL